MTSSCEHLSRTKYEKGDFVIESCLDCGYTEIRMAGMIVKRYSSIPLVFNMVRKTLEFIEKEIQKLDDDH